MGICTRGLKNRIVNGIELYSVSSVATDIYQREAHQQKDLTNEELELKLTALALSAKKVGEVSDIKDMYQFGGFFMTINKRTRKIETVHWSHDNHHSKINQFQIELLKENYLKLGLTVNGNVA